MTTPTLSLLGAAQAIRDRITERSEAAAGFTVPMIAASIPDMLEGFARFIANDPGRRDLLTPGTPFSGTVVGGSYDLATNLVSPNNLLLDYAHVWEIRKDPDVQGVPFHCVGEVGALRLKRPTDVMYPCYAVNGSVLYTRDIDGSLVADMGAITLSGPFIPIIGEAEGDTTLPFSLRGEFFVWSAREVMAGGLMKQKNGR